MRRTNAPLYDALPPSFGEWDLLVAELEKLREKELALMNALGEESLDALIEVAPSIDEIQTFISGYPTILSLLDGELREILYFYTGRPNLANKSLLFHSIWSYDTARAVALRYKTDKEFLRFTDNGCTRARLFALFQVREKSLTPILVDCIEDGYGKEVEYFISKMPFPPDTYISSMEEINELYALAVEEGMDHTVRRLYPLLDIDETYSYLMERTMIDVIEATLKRDPPTAGRWRTLMERAIRERLTKIVEILTENIPINEEGSTLLTSEDVENASPQIRKLLIQRFPHITRNNRGTRR